MEVKFMFDTEYSDATKFVMILDRVTQPQLDMLLKLAQLHKDGRVIITPHPAGRLLYEPAMTKLKTEKYKPQYQDRHNFILEAVGEKRERDMRVGEKPLYEMYPQSGQVPNAQQVRQAFDSAGVPYNSKQFRVMRYLRDSMERGHLYIYPGKDMTDLETRAVTHCVRRTFTGSEHDDQSRAARVESYILAAVIEKVILDHQQS